MKALHLILPSAPRTKKTSNRLVSIHTKDGRNFKKILPSKQYQRWFDHIMTYAPIIRRQAKLAGFTLPMTGPVEVTALFFRDAEWGDLTGYLNALADAIQAPVIRDGKLVRDGLGIIEDDRQITSWDGSRLAKDVANPRIEIDVIPLQGCLLDAPAEATAEVW